MNEREQYEIEQECELHQYFVLKHGPRITSFKVPKAQVGNVETFIKEALPLYPGDAKIYPISLEEYLDIRKINKERRQIFKRIRSRNMKISLNPGRSS